MPLDVLKLSGVLERRVIPVQLPHPFVQMRVAGADVSQIGLEVLNVHAVKSNDGGEQAYVSFGDAVVEVEFSLALRKVLLCLIEAIEERGDRFLVRLLCCSETRLVDTVVYVVIRPVINLFDLLLEVRGEEVDLGVFLR